MPAEHVYLSHYKGYRLEAACSICHRKKAYATDDILDKIGDCQIIGLRTTIANVWGCEKVYNLNWDVCGLRVYIGEKVNPPEELLPAVELKVMKFGAWRANDTTRLGSLASWEHLYGACKCGHTGYIKHNELLRRFGPETTLGDIRPLLRCKYSRKHKSMFFAIKTESR